MSDRRMPRGNDFTVDPLEIIDPVSLFGIEPPQRRWLWENWIPDRAVTVISGDGGTGKSLLALQLATACVTGQKFLGQDVKRCNVLVVACEDEKDELHRRQDSINRELSLGMADLGGMKWLPRAGMDNVMMLFNADGTGEKLPFFDQIVAAAKVNGAGLVVLDTAADLFGGNENIRPQVRQFINALTALALAIDGTVILLAHPSQSGKALGTGESGSTAWSNSVRSRLYLSRPAVEKGEPEDRDARVLSRQKSNYAQMGVTIGMRWRDGAFIPTGSIVSEEDGWTLERKKEAETAFLAGLEDLANKNFRCNAHKGQANFAPKSIKDKTTCASGITQEELEQAMNRLFRKNKIESVEEGPASRRRSFIRVASVDDPEF